MGCCYSSTNSFGRNNDISNSIFASHSYKYNESLSKEDIFLDLINKLLTYDKIEQMSEYINKITFSSLDFRKILFPDCLIESKYTESISQTNKVEVFKEENLYISQLILVDSESTKSKLLKPIGDSSRNTDDSWNSCVKLLYGIVMKRIAEYGYIINHDIFKSIIFKSNKDVLESLDIKYIQDNTLSISEDESLIVNNQKSIMMNNHKPIMQSESRIFNILQRVISFNNSKKTKLSFNSKDSSIYLSLFDISKVNMIKISSQITYFNNNLLLIKLSNLSEIKQIKEFKFSVIEGTKFNYEITIEYSKLLFNQLINFLNENFQTNKILSKTSFKQMIEKYNIDRDNYSLIKLCYNDNNLIQVGLVYILRNAEHYTMNKILEDYDIQDISSIIVKSIYFYQTEISRVEKIIEIEKINNK